MTNSIPQSLRGKKITTDFYLFCPRDAGGNGNISVRLMAVPKKGGVYTMRKEALDTIPDSPGGNILPGFLKDIFARAEDKNLSLNEALARLQKFSAKEESLGNGLGEFTLPEKDVHLQSALKALHLAP